MDEVKLPEGGANIIIADMPWAYRNWSKKVHGSAKAHYDGMTYEQMAHIPMLSWMSEHCVLLMWATWPKLQEALALIAEWELEYVTGWPWIKYVPSRENEEVDEVKIRRGIGFWVQHCSEMILVARCKAKKGLKRDDPQIGLLVDKPAVFYAPIRGHSQKPKEIHTWAEERWPEPRLELFATEEREGWTTWGRSLGHEIGAHGVSEVEPQPHRNRAEFLEMVDAEDVPTPVLTQNAALDRGGFPMTAKGIQDRIERKAMQAYLESPSIRTREVDITDLMDFTSF